MNMPGFTAEAATYGRGNYFHAHAPSDNRSSVGTVTMAGCPEGYQQSCTTACTGYETSCTPCTKIPPPTCPPGEIMCSGGVCSKGRFCPPPWL
jgi:hypothetical protein